jgi:glycine oxidase
MELHEASAAPRPATPDGRPAIGRDPHDGVYWATGGHRHGILLLPLVAAGVDADLRGGHAPATIAALDPGRFAAVRA